MGVQTIEANYKSFVNDPQLTSLANHQYTNIKYYLLRLVFTSDTSIKTSNIHMYMYADTVSC